MALTALDPKNSEVWFGLAEAFLAADVLDAASLAADVALALDPKNPANLVLRGEIALEAGEWDLIKSLGQTFSELPISECPPSIVVQMAGIILLAETQTGRSIL
jgi:thioredoxin-like negative regulator of GroEL